jgi:signal transduction histidine kinase
LAHRSDTATARAGRGRLRGLPRSVVAHVATTGDEPGPDFAIEFALALHDGPLQDVAALIGQVHYLRGLVESAPDLESVQQRTLDAIEDLGAGLGALDHGLRDLAWSVRATRLLHRSLAGALRESARELADETAMEVELDLDDELESLAPGIRSTLLLVVQEALANVRAHSAARTVRVSVRRTSGRVTAEIADDGRGLDVEKEIASAARVGRLGVLGMYERVALLGGTFGISSRPGGPTVVSVALATTDDEPSLGGARHKHVG